MMSQKKNLKQKRRHIDGILLFDKPIGITSNQILQKIRHIYNAEKAGHSGTLDPMATGLLPINFGEATKFSSQLLESNKTYQFTCQLGTSTSTGDMEGNIKNSAEVPPFDNTLLLEVLNRFIGEIQQIPPMVSALHHEGKRLYELAREGIEIERKPRTITISSIELMAFDHSTFTAKVTCSKGTYIRVLAEDIAKSLGTLGHLIYLRRLSIHPFIEPALISLELIESFRNNLTKLDSLLLPIDSALVDLPKWTFTDEESLRILHGQRIRVEKELTKPLYRLYSDKNVFLGIGAPNTPYSIGAKRIIK